MDVEAPVRRQILLFFASPAAEFNLVVEVTAQSYVA
jgi:hypothetical protein